MTRNEIKGAVNTRKKMKTYSKYFCFYFTCLAIVAVILISMCLFGWREYNDAKRVHTELHQTVERLERTCCGI